MRAPGPVERLRRALALNEPPWLHLTGGPLPRGLALGGPPQAVLVAPRDRRLRARCARPLQLGCVYGAPQP